MSSKLDHPRVKSLAREIHRSLRGVHVERFKQADIYEFLAHEHGEKDWNTLNARLNRSDVNPERHIKIAFAILIHPSGTAICGLDTSGGYYSPVQLAQRLRNNSKSIFEGLKPAFTRPDRPGLPRPPMPPLMVTPGSEPRDAWQAEPDSTPRSGDCTPFTVNFFGENIDDPLGTGFVWFLTSHVDSFGDSCWSFGWPSECATVSPIYRFLEEITKCAVDRRELIVSSIFGGKKTIIKFIEDDCFPKILADSDFSEAQVKLNNQLKISRMDESAIMDASVRWEDSEESISDFL